MKLKKAQLNQFSVFESTWIIVLYHIGLIRDDVCNSYKKIQAGQILWQYIYIFIFGCKIWQTNPWTKVGFYILTDPSVFNVWKW